MVKSRCRNYGNYKIEEILIIRREINRKDLREKEKRKIKKEAVNKIKEGKKLKQNNPAHNQLQFMFLNNFCYIYK